MRLVVAFLLILVTAGVAAAERRVALVFGADDYRSLRRLDNAVNDARAMEGALEKLGFDVTTETDRDLRRMRRALEDFREDAAGADVALVFFSGHGVEIAGENRLLPVDADAASLDRLGQTTLPLEEVRETVAAVAKIGLIVLDACRNDPFGTDAIDGRGAAALAPADVVRAAKPGLGRMGRAQNVLFAFSAAPGETASDGTGGNSPFTTALTKYLGTDGLEIRSVLTLVQQEVYDLSRGRQLPYVESGLPDIFFAATTREALPERERLLLAMAEITPDLRRQVEAVASDAGMPLAPLYGALIDLEPDLLSAEQLDARLREAADAFVKVQAEMRTLASADPEVTRLRQAAEEQLSLGAIDAARQRFAEAARIDETSRATLKANFVERTLSEAATVFLSAGAARANLSYDLAIADYEKAVALFGEAGDGAALPEHADRRLAALFQLGELYTTTGDVAAAARAYEALATRVEERAAGDPDPSIRRDLAFSHSRLGDTMATLGDLEAAEDHFRQAKAIMTPLAATASARPGWVRELAIIHDDLAQILLTRGDLDAAEAALLTSLATKEKLAAATPDQLIAQRDLTVTYDALGDLWSLTSRWEDAEAVYRESLRIRSALAASEPDSIRRQRDLSISHDKIGDMLREQGRGDEALDAYVQSRDIVAVLVERDGQDTQLQRDLSVSHNKIGNILRERDDLPGALAAYRDALDIAEVLAERDPSNTDWQRDLSVCLEKVADVLRRQGEQAETLALFERSLGIIARLARAEPGNADWQRDLSITLAEIGNLRLDARDAAGAREAFTEMLDIRQRLARSAPNNTLWQRDLIVAYADYAVIADDPKAALTTALDLARALKRTGRLTSRYEYMIDTLEQRLAGLKKRRKQ